MGKVLRGVLSVCAVLCLCMAYIGAGYGMVVFSDLPTEGLARAFSAYETSPFTQDELVAMGVATKHYSFNTNDKDELLGAMASINENAAARGDESAVALPQSYKSSQAWEGLAAADERYVLTPDAISHLDDCFAIAMWATPLVLGSYVGSIVLLIVLGVFGGPRRGRLLGTVLLSAGLLVFALFAGLGLWVALDFNGFFAAFHSLFFSAGTWTFSWDSLLISMYPPEFWIGMGAVWLVTTMVLSILSIAIGTYERRKQPQV